MLITGDTSSTGPSNHAAYRGLIVDAEYLSRSLPLRNQPEARDLRETARRATAARPVANRSSAEGAGTAA